MPCPIAEYVVGANGSDFHPIIFTVATSSNYWSFTPTTSSGHILFIINVRIWDYLG